MAKTRKKKSTSKPKKVKISKRIPREEKIKQYVHTHIKRSNNPPVGLVTSETDRDMPVKKYSYDPHLDPQLVWTSKAENISFEVDTVSLHVHERIDPLTIIEKVMKGHEDGPKQQTLFEFFEQPENNPPLREAIEFYKHDQGWSNRLIAGDSLLVMNSLLQKEGLGGKVQMIYIDPPYGIKYGSNFQPFINRREVKDGNDEDLTQEPETIKAFRDTWELGIHSYLTYLRDRLLLAKDLLSESGSCFLQISNENVHLVRQLMNEIFGSENFVSEIIFAKTSGFTTSYLASTNDYLIWYAKDKNKLKYRQLFLSKESGRGISTYRYIELSDETRRKLTKEELENPTLIPVGKIFRLSDIQSQGETGSEQTFVFEGKTYLPRKGSHWSVTVEGLNNLAKKNRIMISAGIPQFVRYLDDYPVKELTNIWDDTATGSFTDKKIYVVQTGTKVIQRCILMTTDPGDLVFDPTCGSGTTAFVAEQWGRRWITCDSSRVSITLAKQRLMTAVFDYYDLSHRNEGVASGFKYKTVPHITLGSLANNEPPIQETLYDQPIINDSKVRISGPFTIEAVPAPTVKSSDSTDEMLSVPDQSLSRTNETSRQIQWKDELLKTGVRVKGNQKINFSRIESLPGTQWLHADAETNEKIPKRVVISFGPEYAPLERRQVELAIEEAQKLVPKPKMILFAAFQFDEEAAKDINELNWPGITILQVQMNADLLTEDLKKKRASNESFWLIGQPDIELKRIKDGKYVVEVNGFDYYNTKTGEIESGDSSKIAMWMLDTNYDGRSLYPQQVFFTMAGESDGWSKLAKILKSEINEELIEKYRGTISLPFSKGDNKQVAAKIIDDRGIESLRVLRLE